MNTNGSQDCDETDHTGESLSNVLANGLRVGEKVVGEHIHEGGESN